MESFRPPESLSRLQTVTAVDQTDPFLMHRVGEFRQRIYEVECEGCMERKHTGWVNMVAHMMRENRLNDEAIETYAQNYWAGIECFDADTLAVGARPGGWQISGQQMRIRRELAYNMRIGNCVIRISGSRLFLYSRQNSADARRLMDAGLQGCGIGIETLFILTGNDILSAETALKVSDPAIALRA